MPTPDTSKKLTYGIVILILLSLCLCLTTFALVYSIVSLENNIFQTGAVSINLNDGKPIIEDRELVFAPGMSETKTFFIENRSTCDVYYRLYLENVTGSLADVLMISISDGSRPLYEGTARALTKSTPTDAATLLLGDRQELTVTFSFPSSATNEMQNQNLEFDLRADAVQTKNNPGKSFQ